MAYRIFNGIKYPVPGVDTALDILNPGQGAALTGAGGIKIEKSKSPSTAESPTQKEIEEEIERQQIIYDYYQYERDRRNNFPSGEDQLDMLYHDIKNGNLENGSWIQAMDSVREKFPKPEGPPPPNDIPDNVRG